MAVNLDLAKHIKAISKPRETREQVVDYFRDKYPGSKTQKGGKVIPEWKGKLSDVLEPYTTSKSGGPQKHEYIMRRFQARGGKSWEDTAPSKKQREEYKALGATLPRIPPTGIHVTGTVCVRYQDQPCEPRNISVVLEGDEMVILMETMDMQVIINKYMMIDLDDDEPTISECPCNGDDCQCEFSLMPLDEE